MPAEVISSTPVAPNGRVRLGDIASLLNSPSNAQQKPAREWKQPAPATLGASTSGSDSDGEEEEVVVAWTRNEQVDDCVGADEIKAANTCAEGAETQSYGQEESSGPAVLQAQQEQQQQQQEQQ